MSTISNLRFNNFSQKVDNAIIKIINSFDLSYINDSNNSNVLINKIFENRDDELLFNETVELLKQDKNIREREIQLSNNHSLIISLD